MAIRIASSYLSLLLLFSLVSCQTSSSNETDIKPAEIKAEKSEYSPIPDPKDIPEALKHILLLGTSSSGKTTLSAHLVKLGYIRIAIDDYWEKNNAAGVAAVKAYMKSLDTNRYYPEDERVKLGFTRKPMYDDGIKREYVVYDDIGQGVLDFYKNEHRKLFVIVLYASLNQLVDNVFSRRADDPRDYFVFTQFAEMYELAKPGEKFVDMIDKKSFSEKLKEKLKFLFESEKKLQKFVDDTFKAMGIVDNRKSPIKLRDKFACDLLINTRGKTPEGIFNLIFQSKQMSR